MKSSVNNPRSVLRGLSILVGLVLLASACSASPSPTVGTPTTGAPTATASETQGGSPNGETTVLTVWDLNNAPEISKAQDLMNKEFVDQHPGVQINRVVKSLDDLKATLKLAMSSPDGPDVGQVNQGHPDMGAFVKAGLLLPLNDYATQYGWYDLYSPSIVARNSFSADGLHFGEGNWYGVGATAEVNGVYYNRTKLAAAGLSVPTTFEEFQNDLATLKAAGETPIAYGSLDGWPGPLEYSYVQQVNVDKAWLDDFIFGRNNRSFDTPQDLWAAQVLQDWAQKGYFSEGFAGVGYDEMWSSFGSGQGVFMLTGSWLSPDFMAIPNADDFGFFLMPPLESETATDLAVGGTSLAFGIRATSQHPDLAAQYIDWLISPRARELWLQNFVIPVPAVDASKVPDRPLFRDLVAAWNEVNTQDTMGHYLDYASPTMYDTMVAQVAGLTGGATTPEEFVSTIEADYAKSLQGN